MQKAQRKLRGAYNIKHKLIHGFGINDYEGTVSVRGKNKPFYEIWLGVIRRCYSEKRGKRSASYIDCSICEEWKSLSNFKEWFDKHHVEGWRLDKDLLVKGNREYCPEKCCFLPEEVNNVILKNKSFRGEYPIGVRPSIYHDGTYWAQIRKGGVQYHIGIYPTIEEAFLAYKSKKEEYIKSLADKYKDKLEKRAYDALYEYEVEITD